MSEIATCDNCGRPFGRPSFYEGCSAKHPSPTWAQQVVEAVEQELDDRKGIGWDWLEAEIRQDLREAIAEVVRKAGVELREMIACAIDVECDVRRQQYLYYYDMGEPAHRLVNLAKMAETTAESMAEMVRKIEV